MPFKNIRICGKVNPSLKLENIQRHLLNKGVPRKIIQALVYYKIYGEKYGVRWDLAIFQSCDETDFWKFGGDVKPNQNNYAGIGATGGGVPGESFPSMEEGIHAQIQILGIRDNA